ncbi:hypothetical protein AVEN_223559-1, partial [Araneus ventricosus]
MEANGPNLGGRFGNKFGDEMKVSEYARILVLSLLGNGVMGNLQENSMTLHRVEK